MTALVTIEISRDEIEGDPGPLVLDVDVESRFTVESWQLPVVLIENDYATSPGVPGGAHTGSQERMSSLPLLVRHYGEGDTFAERLDDATSAQLEFEAALFQWSFTVTVKVGNWERVFSCCRTGVQPGVDGGEVSAGTVTSAASVPVQPRPEVDDVTPEPGP